MDNNDGYISIYMKFIIKLFDINKVSIYINNIHILQVPVRAQQRIPVQVRSDPVTVWWSFFMNPLALG